MLLNVLKPTSGLVDVKSHRLVTLVIGLCEIIERFIIFSTIVKGFAKREAQCCPIRRGKMITPQRGPHRQNVLIRRAVKTL